jgi:hypothetical protein
MKIVATFGEGNGNRATTGGMIRLLHESELKLEHSNNLTIYV